MPAASDFWIREAGLELLAAPVVLRSVVFHALRDSFVIAPHHHERELQLDIVADCRGRLFSQGRWLAFDGCVAHVAYPDEVHGYELQAAGPEARVYNIKLSLRRDSMLISDRVLPPAAVIDRSRSDLLESADSLRQTLGDPKNPSVQSAAHLLQMLANWPRARLSERQGAGVGVDSHVEAAVSRLELDASGPLSVSEMARAAGVSDRHLARLFLAETGMTPARYATVRRLDRAKGMLMDRARPISEISDELGFSSPATFSRWFRLHEGLTPTAFRDEPSVF